MKSIKSFLQILFWGCLLSAQFTVGNAQTNTLSTTTLGAALTNSASTLTLASTTNVNVPTLGGNGSYLFIDREMIQVIAFVPPGTTTNQIVQVFRGMNGTAARAHASGAIVWIGNADWFSGAPITTAPAGSCVAGNVYVLPDIHVLDGTMYTCDSLSLWGYAGPGIGNPGFERRYAGVGDLHREVLGSDYRGHGKQLHHHVAGGRRDAWEGVSAIQYQLGHHHCDHGPRLCVVHDCRLSRLFQRDGVAGVLNLLHPERAVSAVHTRKAAARQKDTMEEWGKFFRDNFDKLLLFALFLSSVLLVIHLTHDQRDQELILWGREMSGTVLGALLGLITGHALAQSRTTVTTGPPAAISTETK